ncbi:MAG TPA: EpsI family protein, partial [Rhodoferax sp.]
ALVATLILALPLAGRFVLEHASEGAPAQLVAPAQLSPDWVADNSAPAIFKPAFQNPSADINTTYTRGNDRVGLYLGYYRHQNYERKLVSSENVLVASKDPLWAQVSSRAKIIIFNSTPTSVYQAELRNASQSGDPADERLTVWQVYWVNGALTASNTQAKALGALQRLLGRGDDSAVVILYTAKGDGEAGAQRLQAFVQANGASIIHLLETTQRTQP